MTLSISQVQNLADQAGLKYFLDPSGSSLLYLMTGVFHQYQVVILVEVDGRFLQFRSVGYLNCPPDSPHRDAVMRLLAAINYKYRMIKFGYDESDGEIAVYADMWVMDGTITPAQFKTVLDLYSQDMDLSYPRLKFCIENGEDPGDVGPDKPGPLSDELRRTLGLAVPGDDPPAGGGSGEITEL